MLAIGCDHAGYELKLEILKYLDSKNIPYKDFGTNSLDSCDYPKFGHLVAKAVSNKECDKGLLICGTGVGISLAANKVKGIRAVVCSEPVTAKLSRMHNDSNVLAFGARIVGLEMAKDILDTWLNTDFDGGRHQRRVDLIEQID